ncbi:hypothetical protein [Peribacillus butanolivorans]|uniref:hypothetical protein n=1 Tax=Peribacillus butanolivorans TaxID=421767 RepID=UPI0036D9F499
MIFYRRTSTKNMINEVNEIKTNAKKVEEGGMPYVPMLLFSSNGKGTGWDGNTWNSIQKDFISNADNGKLIKLDCSHYVHNIENERIAKESEKFMESLKLLKTN